MVGEPHHHPACGLDADALRAFGNRRRLFSWIKQLHKIDLRRLAVLPADVGDVNCGEANRDIKQAPAFTGSPVCGQVLSVPPLVHVAYAVVLRSTVMLDPVFAIMVTRLPLTSVMPDTPVI